MIKLILQIFSLFHSRGDMNTFFGQIRYSVLPSTGLQEPAGSQPLLSRVPGFGLQTWDQSNCPELTDHGLVPLRCGSAREPKRPGEARTAHPPASSREDSSREGPVSGTAFQARPLPAHTQHTGWPRLESKIT